MKVKLLLTLALLAAPMTALAQSRQAAPAPAAPPATPPAAPDRTSAAYGDWTLRCETTRPAGQPAQRLCEIALTFTDARNQPVAQMVMGRTARAEPMRVILQVPLEVRVEEAARLQADPAAAAGEALSLPFKLCSVARGGCFAEAELPNDAALRRLRARGDAPGRVTFRDSAGREIHLTMSLRGFGAALDALGREG
ncbi:invasion associated locus B family protein [Roseococcus suduntuyensis]|uniref:Invasion protein IalB n=1 Tax=Roseococcus suduntuyensis TaxID=455361 RepID=A0A840AE70_9PROT|nr:invasion associated locus B family protein [Roseococcus suduntuyensis]MBB3898514.1 invasion protein IalB [Roseococcus suduntuyensis]